MYLVVARAVVVIDTEARPVIGDDVVGRDHVVRGYERGPVLCAVQHIGQERLAIPAVERAVVATLAARVEK